MTDAITLPGTTDAAETTTNDRPVSGTRMRVRVIRVRDSIQCHYEARVERDITDEEGMVLRFRDSHQAFAAARDLALRMSAGLQDADRGPSPEGDWFEDRDRDPSDFPIPIATFIGKDGVRRVVSVIPAKIASRERDDAGYLMHTFDDEVTVTEYRGGTPGMELIDALEVNRTTMLIDWVNFHRMMQEQGTFGTGLDDPAVFSLARVIGYFRNKG